ncbi:uncharacterized protein BO66DRAFT_442971 [Aspergillus aculeatinus CBS 121060]|uniref:Uncharacterized protein n=1 Tax=Aspergillus aculeatinus CBS 121060 TaxID=1448322 RepID=A0ACD1GVR9_9EURO|nr:hypothetical protein BO66DRAFT_442971 [Aspergillus aculeatinus CBS 121060]RAH65564.1 hypothetical protein BO66DRAFT_442971 [Aspergillus aculeatinus CBS 121060]
MVTQACTPKPLLDFVRGRHDLLNHPLLWTWKHLESLGCQFDDLETSAYSESAPKDSQGTADAEALARRLFPEVKLRSLCRLLLGEGRDFARARQGSHFYFQGRPIHRPSYMAFYRREAPLDNSSPPLVGYIHYTDLNEDRIDHCEGLARASRVPGRRQKLLALIAPRDWTEDPYFHFILLALAQRQRVLRLRSPGPELESRFVSRLVVTHALDQESILLCEAAITTDILDALGNLKSAVMPITWPTIHRKMIPYKPYDTFAGRLRDQLVVSSPSKLFDHVNDATSYETKRRQGMDDDGEDDCSTENSANTRHMSW